MSDYRRGTVLGLTIAETFILLTFFLLIALLGLIPRDEPLPEADAPSPPRVWLPPDRIETLVNDAKEARKALQEAEQGRAAAESEATKHMKRPRWRARRCRKPRRPAPLSNASATKRDIIWRYCTARVRTRRAGIKSSAPVRERRVRNRTTYSMWRYTKTALNLPRERHHRGELPMTATVHTRTKGNGYTLKSCPTEKS